MQQRGEGKTPGMIASVRHEVQQSCVPAYAMRAGVGGPGPVSVSVQDDQLLGPEHVAQHLWSAEHAVGVQWGKRVVLPPTVRVGEAGSLPRGETGPEAAGTADGTGDTGCAEVMSGN